MGLASPIYFDVESLRQRIDHGGSDAVQASRDGVPRAAELAAGMKLGHHEFDARQFGFALCVDRDAAAVVADLYRAVRAQDHLDLLGPAPHGLVDRIVDDLPEAVQEATTVVGADVHARALAHGVEALEYGEIPGRVARLPCTLSLRGCRGLCHASRLTTEGLRPATTRRGGQPVNPLTKSRPGAARRLLSVRGNAKAV